QVMTTLHTAPGATSKDLAQSRAWTGHFFASPEQTPISFLYNGNNISGIPSGWTPMRQERRIDATIVETIFEGNDRQTGLQLRLETRRYSDYPVVEWTAWLTNRGNAPTPIISDLCALDGVFAGASPELHHCNGDFYSQDGYTPVETPIQQGDVLAFAPNGGR